jgi:hypothetical protein
MEASAQSTTEKEIVKLSADKYRWYTEKKIDAVEHLYDDDLVFIHITGHISNKKEWIGQMRSGSFVYNQINVKEASAKVYGNTLLCWLEKQALLLMAEAVITLFIQRSIQKRTINGNW